MSKKKKKNKKVEKTVAQQIADYLVRISTLFYVFLMLCIYPLYFRNKYFDMGSAKYTYFKWVSIVSLSMLIVFSVVYFVVYREKLHFEELVRKVSISDWLVFAYLILSFLSYMFSAYPDTAFWGYEGWFMGFMSQLAFVLIYFFVSRYWPFSPITLWAAVAASALAFQMGIVQRFGYNPMGMYDGVGPEDIQKFLSTLGQTSWYSSYAVLIIPFGMYFYWSDERKWVRIASAIYIALGFGMICTTNSDSAYVAMVLVMMVFFCYSLKDREKSCRFLEMAIIGIASFLVIGRMHAWFPEKHIELIVGEERISEFVTNSPIMWAFLVFLISGYMAYRLITAKGKFGIDLTKYGDIVWKITLGAAILVIWGVIMLLLLTTNHKLPEGSGLYNIEFFNFADDWGNFRGFNWRMAVEAMSHASVKDLLFGTGPDTFSNAMDTYCYEEVREFWHGLQLACAHSELLNMLVTEGILGVSVYLGIFVLMFRRGRKIAEKEPVVIPMMAAIVAYLGHNVFCYQQCICTPVIFIIMGMLEMVARSIEGKGMYGDQSLHDR